MKNVNVTIGGKEYEIRARPIGPSKQFREELGKQFDPIVQALAMTDQIDLKNVALGDVAKLFEAVKDTLVNAPDVVLDLLCQYVPDIAQDRQRVEEEGYDEEVMRAFMEVLRIVYPFDVLKTWFTQNGEASPPTTKSSPSASGASSPPASVAAN